MESEQTPEAPSPAAAARGAQCGQECGREKQPLPVEPPAETSPAPHCGGCCLERLSAEDPANVPAAPRPTHTAWSPQTACPSKPPHRSVVVVCGAMEN